MELTTLPGYVPGFPEELGLRELGGLRAVDGRSVRHGLLYRGSALVGLTRRQRELVDGFGLRLILDLRASGELVDRLDYLPAGAEYVRVGGMYDERGVEIDFSPAGIGRIVDQIVADPEGFMSRLYVSMLFSNPATHLLMERFVAGQAPMYVHCTAGKDRTGVCSALLLMALGVDDDTIVREFLLTNVYRTSIINLPPEKMPPELTEEERRTWAQANSVRESDLRAALDEVIRRCGTRERYLEEEFGLDEVALTRLRERYLTAE